MATIIYAGGAKAMWNNDKGVWLSNNKAFSHDLNQYQKENEPPAGANPFPAGVAVELAKRHIKGLKVIEIDKEPKYDPKAIY